MYLAKNLKCFQIFVVASGAIQMPDPEARQDLNTWPEEDYFYKIYISLDGHLSVETFQMWVNLEISKKN